MKTVIGLDFGTQSARAVLIDTLTGESLVSHSIRYPHGVMEGDLASAQDYEDVLEALLSRVTPAKYRESVCGICVDATSLTLVPVAAPGCALSSLASFAHEAHAQCKLWKRHHAQPYANEALAAAQSFHEPFLQRTGGSLSSEWTLPKLLEMRDEATEAYQATDIALDLCEFLTFRLTGRYTRSVGSMCYKGLWSQDLGFPSSAFLEALRPGFSREYARLLRGPVLAPGEAAGVLRADLCERLGLARGVTVASGVLDGHTAPAALGALHDGDATLVIGTSNVLTVQARRMHEMNGVCGVARDGMVPGLYGIDAGQSGTGDMLEWFIRSAIPASIRDEAQARGVDVHDALAQRIRQPWNNRVYAVDWWNGSRNMPCDLSLTGQIAGLTLTTPPEEIYLALLQGIVCGTCEIIEQCEKSGAAVQRVLATGGISRKNALLMQEYANILNRTVSVGQFEEGPALGAAIFAAVAARVYPTVQEAYAAMGVRDFLHYVPQDAHREDYERLYRKNHALRQMAAALQAC